MNYSPVTLWVISRDMADGPKFERLQQCRAPAWKWLVSGSNSNKLCNINVGDGAIFFSPPFHVSFFFFFFIGVWSLIDILPVRVSNSRIGWWGLEGHVDCGEGVCVCVRDWVVDVVVGVGGWGGEGAGGAVRGVVVKERGECVLNLSKNEGSFALLKASVQCITSRYVNVFLLLFVFRGGGDGSGVESGGLGGWVGRWVEGGGGCEG